jgi:hypothetical protein
MRRLLLLSVALVVLLAGPLPVARAADGRVVFDNAKSLQKKWVAWALGSDTAPFLDPTFCGEPIANAGSGHKFFLTAPTQPALEVDCTVDHGVPLIGSPAGGAGWRSSPGMTNADVLAARDADFANVCCPRLRLDGERIDVTDGFAQTGIYTIPVGEDSLIRTVDPTFPPAWTETQVASSAWMFKIVDLSLGRHRLVLRDKIMGEWVKTIFHITVV